MHPRIIAFVFLVANFCLAGPTDDLWKAIEEMNPEALLDACSNGAEVNRKNQHGCSPIYAAVMNYARLRQENMGQSNVEDTMERLNLFIQYLLALGADPLGTNGHGFTALGIARTAQMPFLVAMLENAQQGLAEHNPQVELRRPSVAPSPAIRPFFVGNEAEHAVIYAAPATPRTPLVDEPDPLPAASRLHLLFQEHVPTALTMHYAHTERDESEEEPIGQPGRLPTLRERLTATVRAIPLAGALLNLVVGFSFGQSSQQ